MTYELDFPLAPSEVSLGDDIAYTVTAHDGATTPNTTVSGPWDVYLVESLGRILVIDDSVFAAAAGEEGEIPPDGDPSADKDGRSAGTDRAQWLIDAGYTAEVILPTDVTGESFQGFDAVFLTGDDNRYPIGFPLLRANLVEWVNQGHPILVEGGSIADVAFSYAINDSAFYHTVLRCRRVPGLLDRSHDPVPQGWTSIRFWCGPMSWPCRLIRIFPPIPTATPPVMLSCLWMIPCCFCGRFTIPRWPAW